MKRIGAAICTCAILLSLCGCAAPQSQTDRLSVTCTLFPYYDFVRTIGGDDVDVQLLVAAGRETHSFEPTPTDIIAMADSDILIYNGGEGEVWVDEILSSVGESIPRVVCMMDYADTLEEEIVEGMQVSEHTEEEEEEEIEYDEHIWTSPMVAMELCRVICDTLCAADPTHCSGYRQRLGQLLSELDELDAAFRQIVDTSSRHELIFGDRFPLLYFCKTYGLAYHAAFHGCASDTEPSLATLKYLIDRVRQEDIPVVYTIELSNQKIAEAIAETTGAKVCTFYSCQSISRRDFQQGETYVSLMWRNVNALKEGLNG